MHSDTNHQPREAQGLVKQGRLNEYYKIRIGEYIGKLKIKTKTVLKK